MNISFSFEVDQDALQRLITEGPVGQAMEKAGQITAERGKQHWDRYVAERGYSGGTGFMRDTIHHHVHEVTPTSITIRVGSDARYDIYQQEGTGNKGGGLHRGGTGGIEPAPFMVEALKELKPSDLV